MTSSTITTPLARGTAAAARTQRRRARCARAPRVRGGLAPGCGGGEQAIGRKHQGRGRTDRMRKQCRFVVAAVKEPGPVPRHGTSRSRRRGPRLTARGNPAPNAPATWVPVRHDSTRERGGGCSWRSGAPRAPEPAPARGHKRRHRPFLTNRSRKGQRNLAPRRAKKVMPAQQRPDTATFGSSTILPQARQRRRNTPSRRPGDHQKPPGSFAGKGCRGLQPCHIIGCSAW